jgi:hypothetical protein
VNRCSDYGGWIRKPGVPCVIDRSKASAGVSGEVGEVRLVPGGVAAEPQGKVETAMASIRR